MTKKRVLLAILGLLLCSLSCLSVTLVYAKTTYTTETDELLKNPGKGWMTMFEAAVDDWTLPVDIPSTLFYYRASWDSTHVGPDQYNWSSVDNAIERAQLGGQQIMLRFMPIASGASSPKWMADRGFNGWECAGGWHADLDDLRVRDHVSRFLKALADRYDNHPGVQSIEISFLGCWGEGNHACGCPESILGTEETQRWLMEEHYKYFLNTPIISPVPDQGQLLAQYAYSKYGDTRGAGVFIDCWGDYGLFGPDWSHMENGYPNWLTHIHGSDEWTSWKKGVWKLEPCGVMNNWGSSNVRKALKWALDNHATFIGNKDSQIPSDVKEDVKETLKRLGYRLVLRKAEHPDKIKAGKTLDTALTIENIGVAPPYNDYYLAAQIRNSSGQVVNTYVSNTSVKFWLPAHHVNTLNIPVPSDLANGTYQLAIGIVSPYDNKPAIRMPIQGRESSAWHPVSSFLIDRSTLTPNPPTRLRILNNNQLP